MMERRLLLAFAVLVSLSVFMSGCLTPPKQLYCCDAAIAQGSGYCHVETTINEQPFVKDYQNGASCNDKTCTVLDDDGITKLDIPICSSSEPLPCVSGDCKVMVCGPFNYVPNPFDDVSTQSIYGDTNKLMSGSKPGDLSSFSFDQFGASSFGLFGGTCRFIPMDNYFKYAFDNTKGAYINTFRFGSGGTLEQYEKSRLYFPVSDYFCRPKAETSTDSISGADRFMNYLVGSEEFNKYLNWVKFPKPAGIPASYFSMFTDYGRCAASDSSAPGFSNNFAKYEAVDLGTTDYGGQTGNYLMNPTNSPLPLSGAAFELRNSKLILNNFGYDSSSVDELAYRAVFHPLTEQDISETTSVDWVNEEALIGSQISYGEYLEVSRGVEEPSKVFVPAGSILDSVFYSKALRFLYFGYSNANQKRAPFECKNSGECMSGICSFSPYSRNVCLLDSNGGATECLCTEGFDARENINEYTVRCRANGVPRIELASGDIQLDKEAVTDWSVSYSPTLYATFCGGSCKDYPISGAPDLNVHVDAGATCFTYDPSTGECTSGVNDDGSTVFPSSLLNYKATDGKSYALAGYSFLKPDSFAQSALAVGCGLEAGKDYIVDTFDSSSEFSSSGLSAIIENNGWDALGYPRYVIGILPSKDGEHIGKCLANFQGVVRDAPAATKYGWCEPCTYSTLSSSSGSRYTASESTTGYMSYEIDKQLKAGAIPVVDLSSDSLWGDWFAGDDMGEIVERDSYVKNWISNRGPIIAIVAGSTEPGEWTSHCLNKWCETNFRQEEVIKRETYIRKVCNRCLTAVKVNSRLGDFEQMPVGKSWQGTGKFLASLFLGDDSMLVASSCYDELGILKPDYCSADALSLTDMFVFEYSPNDYTYSYPDSCTLDETQYSAVLGDITSRSSGLLKTYRKPSVMLFGIMKDSCWRRYDVVDAGEVTAEYDSIQGLASYLSLNQDQLTRSGMAGMIYQDYDEYLIQTEDPFSLVHGPLATVPPSDLKGDKFCSFEKGINYINGQKFVFYYTKQYAVEQVDCVEKDSSQKQKEALDPDNPAWDSMTKCMNGYECTLPNGVSGSEKSGYMCPENTVIDSETQKCQRCADMANEVQCTFQDTYGKITSWGPYPVSTANSDSYLDIIASLPEDYVCCLEDDNGAYTYLKNGGGISANSPVIYPASADPDEDCGVYTLGSVDNAASCMAVASPIRYNKVTCEKA